jgi:hypothetical protein
MKRRSLRIVAALATLVAVLSCGGADGLAPTTSAITRPSDSTLVAGLYASAPVAGGYISLDRIAASGSTASGSAAASAEVSWVSLVPGTVPDGTTATIVNRRTAQRITAAIVGGGFDPQPIPASLGDTIQISVSRAGQPETEAVMSLAARPGPRIVRSRPPRGQTDAPLNTIITLVFTEPLDPASVTPSSVTLATSTGAPVAGAVRIMPGPGYIVEFTPSTLLAPLTTYSLTVSNVKNLAGVPLAAPTSIPFTTSTTVGSDPTIAFYAQAVREIPVNSSFRARAFVSSTGAIPTSWRSRDPSIATVDSVDIWYGRVVGIRPGTTVIEGSALGVTDSIVVTVLAPAPASAVSPVVIGFRMLEVEARFGPASNFWSFAPELVLVDTTGRGGSAIIGVSFDFPGLVSFAPCVMDRAVGPDPLALASETYGTFDVWNDGYYGRWSGSEAIAHVTLRIPGPAAMTVDVRGPIVPIVPSSLPTVSGGSLADMPSCG